MGYWVYESWPHNKAIVHKGDCLYCQNGTNKQGTRSSRDGSWIGPFGKLDQAVKKASETKRKINGCCKHCINKWQ